MTEGTASIWAQAFFEEKSESGSFAPGTQTNFTDRLNETFKDIDLQKKAAETFLRKELSINKEGPKGFFARYEILARDAELAAGTSANDVVHVNNLTRLMPYDP